MSRSVPFTLQTFYPDRWIVQFLWATVLRCLQAKLPSWCGWPEALPAEVNLPTLSVFFFSGFYENNEIAKQCCCCCQKPSLSLLNWCTILSVIHGIVQWCFSRKRCSVQPLTFSKTSLFLFKYSRNHAETYFNFFATRRWCLTSWANVAAIVIIFFQTETERLTRKFGWSFCIELSFLAGNNWQSSFCVENSLISCPWGFDWFLTVNTWINPC